MKNLKKSLFRIIVFGVVSLSVVFSGIFNFSAGVVKTPEAFATSCSGVEKDNITGATFLYNVDVSFSVAPPSSMNVGATPNFKVQWVKGSSFGGQSKLQDRPWSETSIPITAAGDSVGASGMALTGSPQNYQVSNNGSKISNNFTITETSPGTYNLVGIVAAQFGWERWSGVGANTVKIVKTLTCSVSKTITVNSASAPSGALTANPNPCIIAEGASTCSSAIGWTFGNTSKVITTVQADGGSETDFVSSSTSGGSKTATWIGAKNYTFRLYDYANSVKGGLLDSVVVYGTKGTISPISNPSAICQSGTGTPTTASVTISWSTSPAYSGATVKSSLNGGGEGVVGTGASGSKTYDLGPGNYTIKMYGSDGTVMDTKSFSVPSKDCTPLGAVGLSPLNVVKYYPNFSLNSDFLIKNIKNNGSSIDYVGGLSGALAPSGIGLEKNSFIGSIFKSFINIAEAYFNVLTGEASSGTGLAYSLPKTANLVGTTSNQELINKGFIIGSNSNLKTIYSVDCFNKGCDSPTSASAEILYSIPAPTCTLTASWKSGNKDVAAIATETLPGNITVAPGTSVLFSWSGNNLRSGESPSFDGNLVQASGSKTITPSSATTKAYVFSVPGPLTSNASCSITVNVSSALSCSPSTQSVNTNTNAVLGASGGDGSYSWSGGGTPSSGGSSSFSTKYSTAGTKTVTLSDGLGASTTCQVVVSDPVIPVSCSLRNTGDVFVGDTATFDAKDGDSAKAYSWSAPGAVSPSGSGSAFSTSYNSAGTKTVSVSNNGQSGSCSVNIKEKPNMYVTLSANPTTVIAGSGPNLTTESLLTAEVKGTVTGKINYTFYCNRSDSGTNITTPWSEQFLNTNNNPQDKNCFSYPVSVDKDTTFTAKVIAERGGFVSEDRVQITVKPAPTLSVGLSVTPNPVIVGKNTTLTATVGGTSTGTINYTFYCDRSASGTNIAPGYDGKYDGVNDNPKDHICNYPKVGSYTAKVIAERGSMRKEARVPVTVINEPTPTPAPNNPPTVSVTSVVQPNYCSLSLGTTVNWTYSDPNGDPQSKYRVQMDKEGSFANPEYDSGEISCESCRNKTIPASSFDFDGLSTYKIRVMVWDSKLASSNWDVSNSFSTPKHAYPQVDFTYSPTEPLINENVQFTNQSSCLGTGDPCRSYSWDFGDGGVSALTNPIHSYLNEKTYSVRLTVTDKDNYSCSVTKDISVIENPPDFKEVAP